MGHYVNGSESSGRIRLTLLIRDTKFSDDAVVNVSANSSDSWQTCQSELKVTLFTSIDTLNHFMFTHCDVIIFAFLNCVEIKTREE